MQLNLLPFISLTDLLSQIQISQSVYVGSGRVFFVYIGASL